MFLLLLLAACKPALPPNVLTAGKLERVLYDFHLAQGMVEHVPRQSGEDYDGVRYELLQAVFRKHGITQEQFDVTMAYYLSDMEKMAEIYKHVADRLERDADALGIAAGPRDAYAGLTSEGDTANVWSDRILFALRNNTADNFQSWNLPCDSTWLPDDDLLWRFELKQITHSYGPGDLYADLVVRYDNDSVCTRLVSVGDRKEIELRIDNPGKLTPQRVSGHLFSAVTADPNQARLYIVFSPSLIRFHKPQTDSQSATLQDSLVSADSLAADSLRRLGADSIQDQRLTPEQLRDRQPVDRTINIVKEKPYQAPRGSNRKRFTQPRRPSR